MGLSYGGGGSCSRPSHGPAGPRWGDGSQLVSLLKPGARGGSGRGRRLGAAGHELILRTPGHTRDFN